MTRRCLPRIVTAMGERVHKPGWNCRLHLWHRWRIYRVSDGWADYGDQYQECIDCGKYRDVPTAGGVLFPA